MTIIVMDGSNGTGTSTMTNRFHQDLPGSIITRHPGSTPLGQELRKLLKFGSHKTTAQQEILLFAADAMLFYQEVAQKNLNKIIICDRINMVGALTYQLAGGADLFQIKAMFTILKSLGWTTPIDKVLIFDAPYSILKDRLTKPDLIDQDKDTKGKKDRFESRGDHYMEMVCENYRKIIRAGPAIFDGLVKEVIAIDASQSIENVYTQVRNACEYKSLWP